MFCSEILMYSAQQVDAIIQSNKTVVLIGRRNLPVIKKFGNIDWFLWD